MFRCPGRWDRGMFSAVIICIVDFLKFKSSVFVITSLNAFDYALMIFLLNFFLMSLCS